MKLPPHYVTHFDHRITVLMTFTIRRELGWFGSDHGEQKNLGDIYRASLEGSGIMLRMLMEFLGVKSCYKDPKILCSSGYKKGDVRLENGLLRHIAAVDPKLIPQPLHAFLARMHDEASKRTAHAGFENVTTGLHPQELHDATKWVLNEIWERCYKPDAITIHGDLFRLLQNGKWEGVEFQSA